MPAGIIGWSPWLDLMHSMPSCLDNALSDYLPSNGFTQGGQSTVKELAKLITDVQDGDEEAILQDLLKKFPAMQYYAHNGLLTCKYVSPILEENLEGTCPIMIVSRTAHLPGAWNSRSIT